MRLYKALALPVLEAHTAALHHASQIVLDQLGSVQRFFSGGAGLTAEEALTHYHLAPLSTRRDLAMLDLLHECATGEAVPQL